MNHGFLTFLANFMYFFLYKGQNCPYSLGDIEKVPVSDTS